MNAKPSLSAMLIDETPLSGKEIFMNTADQIIEEHTIEQYRRRYNRPANKRRPWIKFNLPPKFQDHEELPEIIPYQETTPELNFDSPCFMENQL